jgi:hypothetical protein
MSQPCAHTLLTLHAWQYRPQDIRHRASRAARDRTMVCPPIPAQSGQVGPKPTDRRTSRRSSMNANRPTTSALWSERATAAAAQDHGQIGNVQPVGAVERL